MKVTSHRAQVAGLLLASAVLLSLAVAGSELLRSDERRHALGEAGRRHVQKRHDIKLVAAQYEELYDEVLAVNKRPRSGAWGIG